MTATLASNDGESKLTIKLHACSEYAHEQGFESLIQVEGRHWDGDHTQPILCFADGPWVSLDCLTKLRDHIIAWTRLPLDRLDAAVLAGDFELAKLPGQRASICFGPRPDVILGINPAVTIRLKAGPFVGEYSFVTDQSCLGSFAHVLPSSMAAET